ncbi:MAG: hypothetical protein ACLQVM_02995 [Terriglobia bacterium]
MPRLEHFYGQKDLHYLTTNRKARIFDSDRYKRKFAGGEYGPALFAGIYSPFPIR